MNPQPETFDAAVAALTAEGQPFALERVSIGGIDYASYASMPANLGQYFQLMHRHAAKDFAVYLDERYTFGEAHDLSAAFANALVQRYGVSPGDRVAIVSRNNPQWMMAFIAVVSIGAVAVPMNAWWTTEELEYGLGDCGARVVVADRERAERLVPIATRYALEVIGVDDCDALDMEVTSFAHLVADYAGAEMPSVDVAPDDHATIHTQYFASDETGFVRREEKVSIGNIAWLTHTAQRCTVFYAFDDLFWHGVQDFGGCKPRRDGVDTDIVTTQLSRPYFGHANHAGFTGHVIGLAKVTIGRHHRGRARYNTATLVNHNRGNGILKTSIEISGN